MTSKNPKRYTAGDLDFLKSIFCVESHSHKKKNKQIKLTNKIINNIINEQHMNHNPYHLPISVLNDSSTTPDQGFIMTTSMLPPNV